QLGDDGSGHSPILGWAFDGYPIYGPYGYAKLDGTGGVVRLASSYQLKQGTRPSGPGGTYDGSYIEDYEYVAGSGFLDEHNGRFAITPEYPEGTYHYVVTIDANGEAAYPYAIGPTFYGEVKTANLTGSVALPSAAVQYNGDVVLTVPDGTTLTDVSARANDVRLVKQGLGTLVLDQANTNSGGLLVEAGEVIVKNVASLGTGLLEIRAGARVTLDVGANRIPLARLELLGSGALDVASGSFLLAAGSYDLAMVRALIETARSSGTWSGVGITSSSIQSETFRAVGYSEQPDGSLVIGYSAVGDATMDGSVNIQDLVAMVASGKYGSEETDAQWWEGDFNYDGLFNIVDIVAVSASGLYNSGPYQSTAMEALSAASEQVVFLSAAGSPMTADTPVAIDKHADAGDHPLPSIGPSHAGQSRGWSVGQLAWLALLDQAALPSPTKRAVTFRRLGGA
ncbi:MAG: YHYH protein, partial [Planctomycetota bacterium]|nr:YHYH protein [Planctomycetota bacterium]